MKPTDLKRQVTYVTVALLMIMLSTLIIFLGSLFFSSANNTLTQSTERLEANGNIIVLLQDSLSQTNLLLGAGGASESLLSATSRVQAISDLMQSGSDTAELTRQLTDLEADLDLATNNVNGALAIGTQVESSFVEAEQELSLLKQSRDKVGNGIFMTWVGLILLIPVIFTLLYIWRNYRLLVENFISQVEKYRQLIAVKQVLEAELQDANASTAFYKAELEKAGIKIKFTGKG